MYNNDEMYWSTLIALVLMVSLVVMQGCSSQVKVFECKLDCADKSSMECRTSVDSEELEIP